MQLLMDYSLEFGKHNGLGLISGSCEGFNKYDVKQLTSSSCNLKNVSSNTARMIMVYK